MSDNIKPDRIEPRRSIFADVEGEYTLLLRAATRADIPTLKQWDRDPTVIAAASDNPTATVAFGEDNDWIENIDLFTPDVWEYWIAELDGRPIGAMQMCDPYWEPTQYWGDIEPNLRALDIWIGEPDARGKGYGETMMVTAIAYCFANPAVTAIVIDPLASNTRAHKFYQRLGFVPTHRQMFDEDDCLVHKLTREDWSNASLRTPETSKSK